MILNKKFSDNAKKCNGLNKLGISNAIERVVKISFVQKNGKEMDISQTGLSLATIVGGPTLGLKYLGHLGYNRHELPEQENAESDTTISSEEF
ncbi:hypothetical protein AVEN_274747-1 [Araneus ventricosus]|uniref:Uncharacterized protein n=1 Tax=Araneus ventricosus TaxID=182803 RepID=A0A4Y2QJ65_ARAVE|nr:hypothetical protein AVEN_99854-1 [Araneus ventricosus]GBN63374.1 hypothetical protein AVEN_274747-1 [Araneus ventricosus]